MAKQRKTAWQRLREQARESMAQDRLDAQDGFGIGLSSSEFRALRLAILAVQGGYADEQDRATIAEWRSVATAAQWDAAHDGSRDL